MGIYVSVENLMKFTCLEDRTQYRALVELTKAGYLEADGFQHHRRGVKTRRRMLNLGLMSEVRAAEDAKIAEKQGVTGDTVPKDHTDTGDTHHTVTGDKTTLSPVTDKPNRGTKEKEPKETSYEVSHVRAREAMFLAFWSLYPRKEGGRAARRAWEEVTQKHSPAAIMAGLERHEFSADPQFVPMPAKWLLDGRFLDQPEDNADPTLLAAGLSREQALSVRRAAS
jgi:hypothetical protein